jgi:hypothetical protein
LDICQIIAKYFTSSSKTAIKNTAEVSVCKAVLQSQTKGKQKQLTVSNAVSVPEISK